MSGKKEEEEPAVSILDRKFAPLADGAYDVIVLGTGLKECMIAGMLSVFEGKKVRCALLFAHASPLRRRRRGAAPPCRGSRAARARCV